MRELLSGLVMFALLAGVSLGAVEMLHDRETVVSPPDAVAEQFVRAVMAGRWEPAKAYLEDPQALSESDLAAVRQELGEEGNVDAKIVTRDDDRAIVEVRIPSRNVVKNFALTFDREWSVVGEV